jgi:hypothetical protein
MASLTTARSISVQKAPPAVAAKQQAAANSTPVGAMKPVDRGNYKADAATTPKPAVAAAQKPVVVAPTIAKPTNVVSSTSKEDVIKDYTTNWSQVGFAYGFENSAAGVINAVTQQNNGISANVNIIPAIQVNYPTPISEQSKMSFSIGNAAGNIAFQIAAAYAVDRVTFLPLGSKVGTAVEDASKTFQVEGKANDFAKETFLPDEAYNKNLPKQVEPGTKSLPKYDEFGNLKQTKYYDEYGREKGWVDYTNHGYENNHTSPHWHEVQYDSQYPLGRIIDHRTDPNPPFK